MTILLVVGPESTGTRIISKALGEHPKFVGPEGNHADPLDGFWSGKEALPTNSNHVTRRSFPASIPGEPAQYLIFPDLRLLSGHDVRVVVTSRSPKHAIESAQKKRSSVNGDYEKALTQYQEAYKSIFRQISQEEWPFVTVSIEGFFNDPAYAEGVFEILGIETYRPRGVQWRDPNQNNNN